MLKDTKTQSIGPAEGIPDLKTTPDYSRNEIAQIVAREKIVHLDDLLLRRTLLAYLGGLNRSIVERLADFTGDALGWDSKQKDDEVERTLRILVEKHQLSLE